MAGTNPKLLDLFCGAGGAAYGYWLAGFDVVGVDIEPQPHYPYPFLQMDALEIRSFGAFDAVHASPPCQRWSPMHNPGRNGRPDLIGAVRALLERSGVPWVIENVPLAPLRGPILCGSSFGLAVQRHRRFETNWDLLVPPCAHGQQWKRHPVYDHGKHYLSRVAPVYGDGGGKAAELWPSAMGIDWMDRGELSEAIPPAYTELIGHQLRRVLST